MIKASARMLKIKLVLAVYPWVPSSESTCENVMSVTLWMARGRIRRAIYKICWYTLIAEYNIDSLTREIKKKLVYYKIIIIIISSIRGRECFSLPRERLCVYVARSSVGQQRPCPEYQLWIEMNRIASFLALHDTFY